LVSAETEFFDVFVAVGRVFREVSATHQSAVITADSGLQIDGAAR
jgi:hypothetical protein